MGRDYAGVLGLIAFAIVLARGIVQSAGVNATLWQASLVLFGFALLGYLVGQAAGQIVDGSVRAGLAAQAVAQQAANKSSGTKAG